MSIRRIWVVATNVFRSVVRDRVLYLLGLFTLILLLASRLLPEISSVAAEKTLVDLGLAAIAVFSLVVTLFVGSGLINREIEQRTVFTALSKPLSRSEFIIGKHLGLSAVTAVLIGTMGLVYLVVLQSYGIDFDWRYMGLTLLFLLLELALLNAFALLFGVSTSSLLATLLTLAVYITGHLSPDVVKLARLTDNPGLQQAVKGLYLILPDLSQFNLRNDSVYGILPATPTLIATAAYGVAYTVFILMLSSLIFSKKEF